MTILDRLPSTRQRRAQADNATLNTLERGRRAARHTAVARSIMLVAGTGCGPVAEAAKPKFPASPRCCTRTAPHTSTGLAENLAPLIVELAGPITATCWRPPRRRARTSCRGRRALLDVQQVSDITSGIESADTFVRPIYAGNAMATVQSTDAVKVDHRARQTAFEAPAEGGSGGGRGGRRRDRRCRGCPSFLGQALTEIRAAGADQSARIVISGGRGMQAGDNFAMLEEDRRQAGRRRGRQPRRGRRRLRAERLPGRPDRQGGGAGPLHCGRHLWRDPAPWPA